MEEITVQLADNVSSALDEATREAGLSRNEIIERLSAIIFSFEDFACFESDSGAQPIVCIRIKTSLTESREDTLLDANVLIRVIKRGLGSTLPLA